MESSSFDGIEQRSNYGSYSNDVIEGLKMTASERFFCCDVCLLWFPDVEELIDHVNEDHDEHKISLKARAILNDQWNTVINIEKSIMEMVASNLFKSAKRQLKSSITIMNSFRTNVFTSGDNIFRHFINSMRSRVRSMIRRSKTFYLDTLTDITIDIPPKRNRSVSRGSESDFSSDDNICLQQAINRIKSIKLEINVHTTPVQTEPPEIMKNSYYIIPERANGDPLSESERIEIKTLIKDTIKKKSFDVETLNATTLRRYELEPDEIVPDDAISMTEFSLQPGKLSVWDKMTAYDFLYKNIPREKRRATLESKDRCKSCKDNHNFKSLGCETCRSKANAIMEKDKHLAKRNRWNCGLCEMAFSDPRVLKEHYTVVHHHDSSFTDYCSSLKYDKRSPDAPQCDICFRKFTSHGRLTQHKKRIHNDGKTFRNKPK